MLLSLSLIIINIFFNYYRNRNLLRTSCTQTHRSRGILSSRSCYYLFFSILCLIMVRNIETSWNQNTRDSPSLSCIATCHSDPLTLSSSITQRVNSPSPVSRLLHGYTICLWSAQVNFLDPPPIGFDDYLFANYNYHWLTLPRKTSLQLFYYYISKLSLMILFFFRVLFVNIYPPAKGVGT